MKPENVLAKRKKQSDFIRKMTVTGMLSAITALLVFTPIGMIPLPPPLPSATTVHVPVLLAALVEGPYVGCVVGLVFGVCSFIRAWETGMIGLTLFFRNPLISILPRMLFPLAAVLIYWLWRKLPTKNAALDKLGAGISAALGAVCNTVLCLGGILLFYGNDLTVMLNNMISAGSADGQYLNNAGAWLIAAVGLPNGIGEAIVAAIIVPIVKATLEVATRRGTRKKPKPNPENKGANT